MSHILRQCFLQLWNPLFRCLGFPPYSKKPMTICSIDSVLVHFLFAENLPVSFFFCIKLVFAFRIKGMSSCKLFPSLPSKIPSTRVMERLGLTRWHNLWLRPKEKHIILFCVWASLFVFFKNFEGVSSHHFKLVRLE